MACGLEDHERSAKLGFLLVRYSAAVNGHLDEILLGCLYALGDSCLNFIGFAETPAYDAIFVTNNYDGCESEGATTLGNLGDAVDGNETVVELKIACGLNFIIL